jgi:RHS repeat-associated protein
MQSLRFTALCQYRYDPLDQLIANELPSTPKRQRFYCKNRLATEIQGANRCSLFQHDDQLLAQQQSKGDALDATLLSTDQQRSVLHTLKALHPRQPITYTPYGHHHPGSGLISLLGFNGERLDPVTGYYMLGNGYRAFNPVLMRLNCPDSWSPFGEGGLNAYAYCLNDPANRSDTNGHISFKAVGRLLMSIYRMKRQTAPIKRPLTYVKGSDGFTKSINNGFSTIHQGNSVPYETINAPTLQQLSFNAAPGSQLQKFANNSKGHAALIADLDLATGDINLDNFTKINNAGTLEHSSDSLHVISEKRKTKISANQSALAGEMPGILESRAKLRAIRDPQFSESQTFVTTKERRYPREL